MKKYQKSEVNHLFWCKVDTKDGAFGVISKEYENTYASSNMTFLKIDTSKIDVNYLQLLFALPEFNHYMDNFVVGVTNRKYISKNDLLDKIQIPLPSLELQQKIVNQYNQKMVQAKKKEEQAKQMENNIEEYLFKELEIITNEKKQSKNKYNFLSFINFSKLSRWEKDEINKMESKYCLKNLKDILHFVNRGWKKTYSKEKFNYIEIGSIEPNLGITKTTEIFTKKAPSRATQQVKTGDLIIGTTRPYLKKFAIVEDERNDYICSSGFQVIEKSEDYNSKYILFVLQSDFCIKQFEYFMTGALYPAINKKQLEDIKIPFPPIEIQNKIAYEIIRKKEKIKSLENNIEKLRKTAKEILQNEIFDNNYKNPPV